MSVAPVPNPRPPESAKPISRPIPVPTGNPIVTPERAVLQAAWLAIVLGIAIEGLILAASALFGEVLAARPVTADLLQKVSWSLIVCVALALARTASRASGVAMGAMGLAGLLAAPAAFAVARGLHKGAAQAMGLAAAASAGPPAWLIGALRGVEYALLGVAIGWIARKSWAGAGVHAAAGAAAALLFGLPIFVLKVQAAPAFELAPFAARAVSELLFPVGCALVLYASDTLGKRLG